MVLGRDMSGSCFVYMTGLIYHAIACSIHKSVHILMQLMHMPMKEGFLLLHRAIGASKMNLKATHRPSHPPSPLLQSHRSRMISVEVRNWTTVQGFGVVLTQMVVEHCRYMNIEVTGDNNAIPVTRRLNWAMGQWDVGVLFFSAT